MTAKDLTIKAELGLSGTQFWVWFDGCDLKADVLTVPSQEAHDAIERLFGAQLRAAMPNLHLIVSVAPVRRPSPLKTSAPAEFQKLW